VEKILPIAEELWFPSHLKHTDIVTSEKRLAAYVERCTSRPAFKRAFNAQIGDFRKAA
jgi:glutathione S-transferase